jgi:hypothetical protein
MYTVNGTRGGLTGNWDQMQWKYFDWRQAPKQKLWKPWSLDRGYPREELPWIEKSWALDPAAAAGKAVGYTLRSYRSGAGRIYDGLYDAIVKGRTLLVTLPEVRRQIAVLEAAHRQNPLPRKLKRWPA